MKLRSLLIPAILAPVFLQCPEACAGTLDATPPARKPNILLIVSDDAGYADFGFQGCKDKPAYDRSIRSMVTPAIAFFTWLSLSSVSGFIVASRRGRSPKA